MVEGFRKQLKGKRVICGFNGSLDSVVTAYLLKRQGFDVVGLGISFFSSELEALPARYDDEGQIIEAAKFRGVYNIEDLDTVKALADKLGILFYAVDASLEYKDQVTDYVVAARLGGIGFCAKVNATNLIFSILNKKAEVLSANFIATGHYAKLVKNQSTQTLNIFVSHDLKNDQSFLLSNLPENLLEKVKFPLSDMRKIEVEHIGRELRLNFLEKVKMDSLEDRTNFNNFIADRAPPKMIKSGQIIDYKNDFIIGEHEGIYQFSMGMKNIKTSKGTLLDKSKMVIGFKYSSAIVFVGEKEDMLYNTMVLSRIYYPSGIDFSRPLEIYVKNDEKSDVRPAYLFFLNNGHAKIEFRETLLGTPAKGDHVVIYNRSGTTGKVIGSGVIQHCGLLDNGELRKFPHKKDVLKDEDEPIVDIYSFRF